jgi:hypothetical protein
VQILIASRTDMVPDNAAHEWVIERAPPGVTDKNVWNLGQLFHMTGVNPQLDILTHDIVELPGVGRYVRIVWKERRGWQRAMGFDPSGECYTLGGGHATIGAGCLGIFGERCVKPGNHIGVYGKMSEKGDQFEWVAAASSWKNYNGIIMELKARCQFKRLLNGGVWAEDEFCRDGFASHLGRGQDSRWAVPEQYIDFVGCWIPFNGVLCDDLPRFRRGF